MKSCLAIDPYERKTAKQLLDHPYLSIHNSDILRQYQKSLVKPDDEEQKVVEVKSNMPEVIEESELSSTGLIKEDLTGQMRFETEQDDILGSQMSNG